MRCSVATGQTSNSWPGSFDGQRVPLTTWQSEESDVYPDQQIRAVKRTVDKFEEERQI